MSIARTVYKDADGFENGVYMDRCSYYGKSKCGLVKKQEI